MERFRYVGFFAVFLLLTAACNSNGATPAAGFGPLCPMGDAIEIDGQRRLALLVGVGDYLSRQVPDLAGPPNDARRMYKLLTHEDGYGFPPENVCMLLDRHANSANFREAFRKTLTERARSGDVAVLFFAGHGSQTRDTGGDEPDGWDETFVLHDSRYDDIDDLRDDELNHLLSELHQRTRNITAIFDSCNSGTAVRSGDGLAARFVEPAENIAEEIDNAGDGSSGPATRDLSGLVAMTAASDGTAALERRGRGIFTDALLDVLGQARGRPLTYAQLARQVPALVSADSYQIPYFQGELQQAVFGNQGRTRPPGLDVIDTSPVLELSGTVLPGVGSGAELRIYSGSARGDVVNDPAAAKATAVVIDSDGLTVRARVVSVPPDAEPVVRGDLAVLAWPADDYRTIRVGIKLGAGGLAGIRAARIKALVSEHAQAARLVEFVESGEDFELTVRADGKSTLRGPENRTRNLIDDDDLIPRILWLHARQRALLKLRGEGGAEFVDNETLKVQLVPASHQESCADGEWLQSPPNADQIVPLCHSWNVRVTLSGDAGVPLLIGAAVLSADGAMFGLPRDGRAVRLRPGESYTFDNGETFRGTPPLDSLDRVMVFGTQQRNPVAWQLLTQPVSARGHSSSSLGRALQRYFMPGSPASRSSDDLSDSTWTLSSIGVRVEANARFLSSRNLGAIREREYTIPSFDIRPYLPDDPNSALRRVLDTANRLANVASSDGAPYAQHDWSLASDASNLKRGIDCSRSIWFAFTRSGLRYNQDDRYLYTGLMVGAKSPMNDEFEACPADEPYRIGDVLVYRSESRGDGHTVMVIDPEKRIAWGSMGWDGGADVSGYALPPDVGVEYQRIKYKPDWARWDRRDMTVAACWRYRRFTDEADAGLGLPGTAILGSACDAEVCPLETTEARSTFWRTESNRGYEGRRSSNIRGQNNADEIRE